MSITVLPKGVCFGGPPSNTPINMQLLQQAIAPTGNASKTQHGATSKVRPENPENKTIVPGTVGQGGQRTELVWGAGELYGVVVPIENPTSRETTQMRDFSGVANDGGVSTEVQVLREEEKKNEAIHGGGIRCLHGKSDTAM